MMKRAKCIRCAKLEYSSNVYNRQITEKTRKCAGVKRRKGKADNVSRQTNRRRADTDG